MLKQGGEGESAIADRRENQSNQRNEEQIAKDELFAAYQYDLDGFNLNSVNRKKGKTQR